MTEYIAFAIFDAKLDAYMPPFFLATRPQAIRAFADHVNTPGEMVNKHPEDYTLHQVGRWRDDGELEGQPPELVARATDYVKPSNQLDITDAIERKLKSQRSA